jgi:hypothetical protein
MGCRLPECRTRRRQRFGLCNKHRKWVEKGYMTADLVMLKNRPRVGSYSKITCRVPLCLLRARRHFLCDKHSGQYKRGSIDLEGNLLAKSGKILGQYPKDYPCKVCKRSNCKISKGFCPTHYNQYLKGNRDIEGFDIQRRCKASRCRTRLNHKTREWCYKHYPSFLHGVYNSKGRRMKPLILKNRGKKCKVTDCVFPAHCKELCALHYSRSRGGYLGTAGYKNVGKQCSEQDCSRPAVCRTLCSKHYWSYTHPPRKYINKDKICKRVSAHCKQPAYCKGLCIKHYNNQRRPDRVQDTTHQCVV